MWWDLSQALAKNPIDQVDGGASAGGGEKA